MPRALTLAAPPAPHSRSRSRIRWERPATSLNRSRRRPIRRSSPARTATAMASASSSGSSGTRRVFTDTDRSIPAPTSGQQVRSRRMDPSSHHTSPAAEPPHGNCAHAALERPRTPPSQRADQAGAVGRGCVTATCDGGRCPADSTPKGKRPTRQAGPSPCPSHPIRRSPTRPTRPTPAGTTRTDPDTGPAGQ